MLSAVYLNSTGAGHNQSPARGQVHFAESLGDLGNKIGFTVLIIALIQFSIFVKDAIFKMGKMTIKNVRNIGHLGLERQLSH